MKTMFILRGVPGCGKSSCAESLTEELASVDYLHIEADMFFERNGEYKFDSTKLGEAHKWCFESVKKATEDNTPVIIVSNTSTRSEDVLRYKNLGEESGYKVHVLTVENWHGGSNIHDVSEEKLVNMEKSLRNSMRLK